MVYSFSLFGREIPLYGLFFYLGIAVAVCAALILLKKKKVMPAYELAYSAVFTMIGAILGAKLLFLAINLPALISMQISLIAAIKGGFVFYGGFIGGLLGLYIYVKIYKLPFFDYADLFAAVVPLGHAFGRVGCFFGGCCYGMPYDGPLHVVYTQTAGMTPLGVPLFPVQLLESVLLVLLFAVLFVLYLKTNRPRLICAVYLLSYAVMRFCLEFLRYDAERGGFWGLSTSQWISLAVAVAVAVFFIVCKKKAKGKEKIEKSA